MSQMKNHFACLQCLRNNIKLKSAKWYYSQDPKSYYKYLVIAKDLLIICTLQIKISWTFIVVFKSVSRLKTYVGKLKFYVF